MKDHIIATIDDSIRVRKILRTQVDNIAKAAEMIIDCLRTDGKIVLFGNGGSAADAQHIAAEFVGRYLRERRPLPAIALTVNTSSLTAIANDQGYERVFERQIDALCESRDIAVGISTSGNSRNVLLGLEAAKQKKARTLGLTGSSGGELAQVVDLAIRVPSDSTPRIQECHIMIGHILSDLAEQAFPLKEILYQVS